MLSLSPAAHFKESDKRRLTFFYLFPRDCVHRLEERQLEKAVRGEEGG
jgi:hypothetical protein